MELEDHRKRMPGLEKTIKKLFNKPNDSSNKFQEMAEVFSYLSMFRYVLHLTLDTYRDLIQSRAKPSERYLKLPLRRLL
jgi:hypothetical protein